MKKLFIALLATFVAQAASAGAPPKVDPNAPPPDYYVEPSDADQANKKAKKEKVKKDKKSAEGKQ